MSTRRLRADLRLLAAAAMVAATAAACVGGSASSPSSASAGASALASAGASALASSPESSAAPTLATTVGPGAPSASASSASTSRPPSGGVPLLEAQLSEADNGKSITVARGANVELTLHNVYWRVQGSSDGNVVAMLGAPVYSGAGTLKCIPGTGCGTVKATFKALTAGTATISASRTTCGEALQCVGTEGTFEVTLVVE